MKQVGLRTLAFALAAGCIAAAAAQTAPAPVALSQAVAATEAAKADYAFDLDISSAKQNWRAHYDPGASPRLRLVQPSRDTLDDAARRQFDQRAESMEGVSWCASENLAEARNVRLVREDETSATYAFQPSAEMMQPPRNGRSDRRGQGSAAFVGRMQGELTLTKENPDVTQMRIFAPQAFSPLPLVRLERINVAMRCAVAPNGRRYAAETVFEFRGSAFGRSFDERSVQRASNLTQ